MAWILLKPSNYKQVAPLVRTGGSRHTGLPALPHRDIHLWPKQYLLITQPPKISYTRYLAFIPLPLLPTPKRHSKPYIYTV